MIFLLVHTNKMRCKHNFKSKCCSKCNNKTKNSDSDLFAQAKFSSDMTIQGLQGPQGPPGPPGPTGASNSSGATGQAVMCWIEDCTTDPLGPITTLDPADYNYARWQPDSDVAEAGPNAAAIIQPNANGALQAARSGARRGINAIDLQISRLDPTQIAAGNFSVIGGGQNNIIDLTGLYSVISGGLGNGVTGNFSTIGGGGFNSINALGGTISGGATNVVNGILSTIGGGSENVINSNFSIVGGGNGNKINGFGSTICGGIVNSVDGIFSSIVGGNGNGITGGFSSIGGGQGNIILADYASIPSGQGLLLTNFHSSAVGKFNEPGFLGITGAFVPPFEVGQTGTVTGPIGGNRIFMVGFGGDESNRSNLMSVTNDGVVHAQVGYAAGGADYAEWFESVDGVRYQPGTPVALIPRSNKICPAKPGEIPFGVVSSNASLLGNASDSHWHKKFRTDPYGRLLVQDGQHVLSPDYNPDLPYIPRSTRPEWNPIALLGRSKVIKGSPTSPNWIYLGEVKTDQDLQFELWLIR